MALETLTASLEEAARLMDTNYRVIEEAQRPRVHRLGTVATEGVDPFPVFRAHSGPDDLIGKGGVRLARYPSEEVARNVAAELSVEMLWKLFLRGYTDYKGGKAVGVANPGQLDHEQKLAFARQFEHLMEDAGFVGHNIDVPAGDVGTNGLSTEYALERHRRHPKDKYWKAVATGKSTDIGGHASRPAATGWGSYAAHDVLMDEQGEDEVSVALQGFGNAGAWYAHFASNDSLRPKRIGAIGEREGVLWTPNPQGIIITRGMVDRIGDNLDFTGPKLSALARMIEQNQPGVTLRLNNNPSDIINYEADYFVPAALGNVLTEDSVGSLGARRGVVEIANGPTTLAAHRWLTERGLVIAPDIWVNGGGVDCSNKEHQANIAMADDPNAAMPSTVQVEAELAESSKRTGERIFRMAEKLGTQDLRVAAAAVSMGAFAARYDISMDPALKDLATN